MRLLDRYLYRAVLPPFLIALGVFTFLMAVNPTLEYATRLIAKGVDLPTVGELLLTLIPQALSLTIPIAFLTGLLMGLGRLSGDRESVALQACGVSPLRVLRPVMVLALIVAGIDMYVLMRLKPDANQHFREVAFQLLTQKSSSEIKPRIFYEGFPQKVIYVQDATAGVWSGVIVADTTDPLKPSLVLAESGQLVLDEPRQLVQLVLTNATRYAPGKTGTTVYAVSQEASSSVAITAESMFGSGQLGGGQARGFPEMDYAMLQRSAEERIQKGESPHNEILHQQQMFSFPVACLVFAVIGLGLGLHTRKEGRLAGFAVAIAVVLAYYALMALAESWVKGNANAWIQMPAQLARWVPNIVIGLIGLVLVWRRSRSTEGRLRISLPRLLSRKQPSPSAVGEPPASPPRTVMVVRIPTLTFPGPRILDRYVTNYYLRIAGLAFAGLLTVFYLVSFVDLSDKVFKGQAGLGMLLAMLWYQTPQFLAYILPVAVLIGVLGTIGGLTRSSELMVMRACGISLYRVAAPMLALALVASGVLFVLDDRVIGEATLKAETINADIRKIDRPRLTLANPNWLLGPDGRIYHYQAYEAPNANNGHRPTLYGLSVFETAEQPFRLQRHSYVARASFVAPAWVSRDGWLQNFRKDGRSAEGREDFHEKLMAMPPVDDFRRAQIDSSRMNFGQLRQYVRRLGSSGVNVSEQASQLHRKLAFPAVTVVLTLLAIPFGVTTGKKGALYGIGLALVLAGTYFLLTTLFMAAGAAGALPAPLAAWAVNLLFAIGALYLVFTVRT